MKRIIAVVAALALCVGVLAGCTAQAATPSAPSSKVKVVCATFPAYDWVKQVVGDQSDRYEITYLMGSGTDLHSYQPTVDDIAKISSCDLFVYVGGESDGWAEDAVKAAANPNMHVVNMLEAVGDAAVEEEVVEGMQAEGEDHDHDHESEAGHDHTAEADHDHDHTADAHDHEGEAGHHHDESSEPEYDEHVWLSLRNAQKIVDAIAGELSAVDASAADTYAANAKAYKQQLADLDGRYSKMVKDAKCNTVVFADRFPFRYLVDDYNLSYYAAFVGCSAETEASFDTIAFLAKKVDELGLKAVLVIEGSDQKIAQTVVQGTTDKNQKILVMDSLQSTPDSDVAAGKTYLSAMEGNLKVLAEALN